MTPHLALAEPTDDRFEQAAIRWWHPVARSRDIEPGDVRPVRLLGEELVAFRAPDGTIGVVDDLCPHRGTRLSAGTVTSAGYLRCPYHGWAFERDGRCMSIPQAPRLPIPEKATVRAHRAAEAGGLVWVRLAPSHGTAEPSIPGFADADPARWRVYVGDPMEWQCQAARQIENFLDIAHFSVIHADTFGNAEALEMDHYEVTSDDDGTRVRATYEGYPARVDFGRQEERVAIDLDFEYEVTIPFAVKLTIDSRMGKRMLWCATSPVSATESLVFWASAAPSESPSPDEAVEAGERAIFYADRAIVEGQRPERLPLDLPAELHLPFDRLAVAYRRALASAGFPGGQGDGST